MAETLAGVELISELRLTELEHDYNHAGDGDARELIESYRALVIALREQVEKVGLLRETIREGRESGDRNHALLQAAAISLGALRIGALLAKDGFDDEQQVYREAMADARALLAAIEASK